MKKTLYLFGCLFLYLVFGLALVWHSKQFGILFFVWNVFLAILPFLFSRMLTGYLTKKEKNRLVIILLSFLWLVFFPNAPYMITDLIYAGGSGYFSGTGTAAGYTASIYSWAKLIYIGSGVIFAALVGLRSLFDIHRLLIDRFGKTPGALYMAAVCLLSGFGIYIGRILRFNSWDVLRPFSLLLRLKEDFSSFSILYSLLLSAYIAASYIVFYIVMTAGSKNTGTGDTR